MKKSLMSFAVVLSTTSLSGAAEEFSWGDVTFQPRVYAGYSNYQLKSETFDFTFLELDGSETYINKPLSFDYSDHSKIPIKGVLVGIGGTISSGPFFGDFYYQSTPKDNIYSGFTVDSQEPFPYQTDIGSVDAQHFDWAISIGYMLNEQWSIFAGYKVGNTEWDQSARDVLPNSTVITDAKLNAKFDQGGPFLGTSYSLPIGSGLLTFKAAYAYLDGTYKWENSGTAYDPNPYPGSYLIGWDLDGNSNAYSFGISWTQSITDSIGYSLSANYHRYKFGMSGTQYARVENSDFTLGQANSGNLTEELFTLTWSVFYRF